MIYKQLINLKLFGFSLVFLIANGLSAQQWTVENLAGIGEEGFTEGIPPLENGFGKPNAICTDQEGNVYFTVNQIDFSLGISILPASGIYKMDPTYSTIEMILDSAFSLTGIAVDKAGNIYFSKGETIGAATDEFPLEYIYKIKAEDGEIVEYAGNGVDLIGSWPEEGALADETPIGNAGSLKIREEDGVEWLYYCATLQDNNFIQKINLSDKRTYRVAGSPHTLDETYTDVGSGEDALSTEISLALGLAWDSKGNLYYSSLVKEVDGELVPGSYTIKKIVDGKIYHVTGNGTADYSGDDGPAASAGIRKADGGLVILNDELLFADGFNKVIRKVVLSTTSDPDGMITTVCGTGFDEGTGENPGGDVDNGFFKLALKANVEPFDLIYLNEEDGFCFTDNALRIRHVFNCDHAEVVSTSLSSSAICKGDNVEITFNGSLNDAEVWRWYEGSCNLSGESLSNETSLSITADEATKYYLVGTGGCVIDPECTEITIDLTCKEYFNTFTPNDDGKNEFLEIPVLDNFPENTVTIYNRWGDVLEQIENYDNVTAVWRGTNGGTDPVDSGTYFFTAESGGELITSGWIELIK